MFEWLFRKKVDNATLKEPEWWRQSLVGQSVDAGVIVSESTAMQLSAVYACVRILAESIGSLPLKIYQRRSDGGKDVAINHPLSKVFSGVANPEMTPQELLEYLMASTLLRGTSYNEIIYNGRGEIAELWPLDSKHMHVTRSLSGQLVYDYQAPNDSKVIPNTKIWRVPGLSGDGVTGYSVVSLAKQSLGTSIATERHAAKIFANGTRVPAVLEAPGPFSDEAFERLKLDLNKHTGVDNAGKTLILEEGMKYNTVGMTNDDAQFLESRKFQIAEIARWFRVPLHLLNELDKATFSNIEHQSIEFVTHTLRPWCKRIEYTITRDLIMPKQRGQYFAEFSLDALLRGDTPTRYAAHAVAINTGWMTPNEVRRLENLNPAEGLDEFRVPLNMGAPGDEPEEDKPEEPADETPEDKLKALNGKEVRAIRAEHGRLSGDKFDKWLNGFYLRIAEELVRDGVELSTALDYVDYRQNQINNAQDVPALLDKWENE